MIKRFSYAFVVIFTLLLFNTLPLEVEAATSGYYTYTVSGGKATITECDQSISGDVVIPSKLGGYPVVTIGSGAFLYCYDITSVSIPNTVQTIGASAFCNCKRLTTVTMTDSVTSIGADAFITCYSLQNITLSKNITAIKDNTFSYCTSLRSITIPDKVTEIGKYAFETCHNLETVNFGKGVTKIGTSAFEGCKVLKEVVLPDAASTIEYQAFYKCYDITSVTFSGNMTTIGGDAFVSCSKLKTVHFRGLEEQWDNIKISYGNTYLKNATIDFYDPNEIVTYSIVYDANGGTNAPAAQNKIHDMDLVITSLTPNRLGYDFVGWSTTPNGSVSYSPYDTYTKNERITLYAVWKANTTIYTITYNANGGSNAPTTQEKMHDVNITLANSIPTYSGHTFAGWSTSENGSVRYNPGDTYSANANLTLYAVWNKHIASGYCGNNLKWYLEKDYTLNITGFGDMYDYPNISRTPWYSYMSDIKTIKFDDRVTHIGDYSFFYSGVTSVVFPQSLKSIGTYAFGSCTMLTEVNIPSVVTIKANAFDMCTRLKTLVLPDGTKTIGDSAFVNCKQLKEIELPNSVETVGKYAFAECYNATKVVLGKNLKTLGDYSFYGCSFDTIYIYHNLSRIGAYAFDYCEIETVYYTSDKSKWNSISIGTANTPLTSARFIYNYYIVGDIDAGFDVSIDDAILLFQYSILPDVYPIEYSGSTDFNKDGTTDIDDAILLFQHSMLPDLYPIE